MLHVPIGTFIVPIVRHCDGGLWAASRPQSRGPRFRFSSPFSALTLDVMDVAKTGMWLGGVLWLAGCGNNPGLEASDPARGPAQLVGNGSPVSDGNFRGGADALPPPAGVTPPPEDSPIDCDANCAAYCDGLALENPVNIGVCESLWGVGLSPRPLEHFEACRRLFVDFVGRYPSPAEVRTVCAMPSWGETVTALQATPEYRLVNQRRWADKLLYNNRAVNFERAFDMDELVGKAFSGLVSWDQFAAVTSAHPVFVRRYDNASDRVSYLFKLFLGRPPYENERSDMARLYRLWNNGYWEHPHVGLVPDAFIEFACVDEDGNPSPETVGECTSILWGHNELTLAPDRSRITKSGDQEGMLWAGKILPSEWEALQLPGRIVASQPAFWEFTVDEAIEQFLGYPLTIDAPRVRNELVRYVLEYGGDIRALHFAIATSAVYLQSNDGASGSTRRWTYGPMKQIQVEGWIDSLRASTGYPISACDHRLPNPEDYAGREAEENGVSSWGAAMVRNTRWQLRDRNEVDFDYRNLARSLGGCPSNEAGGRFTTVSVLNTAVQESFVASVCGIGGERGVDIAALLPPGMDPRHVLDDATAEAIVGHQLAMYLGRFPTEEELEEARFAASSCTPAPCDASTFSRPLCFSLLSSSEMLFY